MTAYVIAEVSVSDASAYEVYKRLAQQAITEFGGRYLARGGEVALLEGDRAPDRLVIVAFDRAEQARLFYDSETYRLARDARKDAATMRLVLVEGLPENLV